MHTPQHLVRAVVLGALVSGAACNRADTDAQAKRAAADVRAVASKAGDHVADAWVTTQIQAKYFADRDIKARYIDVSTSDRVVTVAGYVPSDEARRRVVQMAKDTNGVREVQDRLLIGRAPQETDHALSRDTVATTGRIEGAAATAGEAIDDARVTTTIQSKYFMSSTVKGRHIDVDSRGGIVTLRGEVGSEAEREEALRLARQTEGVQRVEDTLTVNAAH